MSILNNVLSNEFSQNIYFSNYINEIESLAKHEVSNITESLINEECRLFNSKLASPSSEKFLNLTDSSLYLNQDYTDDIER